MNAFLFLRMYICHALPCHAKVFFFSPFLPPTKYLPIPLILCYIRAMYTFPTYLPPYLLKSDRFIDVFLHSSLTALVHDGRFPTNQQEKPRMIRNLGMDEWTDRWHFYFPPFPLFFLSHLDTHSLSLYPPSRSLPSVLSSLEGKAKEGKKRHTNFHVYELGTRTDAIINITFTRVLIFYARAQLTLVEYQR